MEATVETILKRLKEKQAEEDWPEDIKVLVNNLMSINILNKINFNAACLPFDHCL